MRVIQAGMLICLVAITGLLFAMYRQQGAVGALVAPETELAVTEPEAPAKALTMRLEAPTLERAEAPAARKPTPLIRRSGVAPPVAKTPSVQVQPAEPEAPSAEGEETSVVAERAEEPAPPMAIEGAVAEQVVTELAEPLREETPVERREPRVVSVPAGQRLAVRIDNTLSTSRNRVDDTFFASLDEPLIVDGLIIADKGARLEGRVLESQQAGRVKGLSRLVCELTRLHTDDGQRSEIRTSTFVLEGPETRKDDLKKVAMGAGAGAILGAIFGGGKGAAIGAASGAGAGAGTAAMTRGEPAVIEPETRLEFRLTEGVTITEKL